MSCSEMPTNFPEEVAAFIRRAGRPWLEAIHDDQARRWASGQRVPAEAYREAVPALRHDLAAWHEVIFNEFQLQLEFGDHTPPDVFLRRFPDDAEALRSLFEDYHDCRSHSELPVEDLMVEAEPITEIDDLPHQLGGFLILQFLGGGGQGRVFRAFDQRLRKEVALKVLRRELLADPNAHCRFLSEAQKLARVSSDHVVRALLFDDVAGFPILVMDLLAGESLQKRLDRYSCLSWREAARIGLETAQGLDAIHRCDIIHRDIKPSNIWLEDRRGEPVAKQRERVKIIDFGLARTLVPHGLHTTGFGGTPNYASPEQADRLECDPRTDLFSLGCVLYQMLTGKLAFPGNECEAVLQKVKAHYPPPVIEMVPEVPVELSRLVERLMAKDRADRPTSARAVIDFLSGLIEREGQPALPGAAPASEMPDPGLVTLMRAWSGLPVSHQQAILLIAGGG